MTQAQTLQSDPRFTQARDALLGEIARYGSALTGVRPALDDVKVRETYQATLERFTRERGRALYFPFLGAGFGQGPLVELADGSVKYDLINGIGVNFFGHNHPELLREAVSALPADIMQGNLEPGLEMAQLTGALLERVGKAQGSRLAHAWLTTCGTMANEIALKIIRQKKAPATKLFAFSDCFAGRSTAMQEVTDNPKYREGQPTYGEVTHLPFYKSAKSIDENIRATVSAMEGAMAKEPGRYAGIMIELVQGEGGFHFAPREWYVAVLEAAKRAGLAIWIDEIQTFGRTGRYFAYQTFGLEPLVDVVTVAKMLQAAATLFTAEYNPKPGLVSGTFSGSTIQLRTARRTLELLDGTHTRVGELACKFAGHLERLAQGPCKGMIGERRILGGMIAFQPFAGTMDQVKAVLMKLFDLGVIAFYCGHDPYLVRMLPPLGAMTEAHLEEVTRLIERALCETARGAA